MSSFKDFKYRPSGTGNNMQWLLGIVIGFALVGGLIYFVEMQRDKVDTEIMSELQQMRDNPGQPTPPGWHREERRSVAVYYTPPIDICKRMTAPGYDLPAGVRKIEPRRGHCTQKNNKQVMVITVDKDRPNP